MLMATGSPKRGRDRLGLQAQEARTTQTKLLLCSSLTPARIIALAAELRDAT